MSASGPDPAVTPPRGHFTPTMAALEISSSTSTSSGGGGKYHLTSLAPAPYHHISNSLSAAVTTGDTRGQI